MLSMDGRKERQGEEGKGKKMGIKLSGMRRYLFLTFTIFLLLVYPASAQEGFVKFLGKKNLKVFLEVAVTDEEKAKGLMNRPSLPQNRGMVFVFRPAQKVTFWMKDTLILLDMIFIDRGKIVKITKNAEPNQTTTLYPSDYDVTEVIEVNGGFADEHMINVGNRVAFKNISQIDYSMISQK